MEPNFLGTPIVTSVLNSARETTVTVVVSTQESPVANMEESKMDKKSVSESVSQSQTKIVESVLQQTPNRVHKIDASTTMGVLSSPMSVPPVQVPATPLKLQQLLTQSHQQSAQSDNSVVVQLPVSASPCSSSDPNAISMPSSHPSVLHSPGLTSQPVVVQVGQGRQQVTCVPSTQTVGLSGQRNQECHLIQPHSGLMPSVVVQVAKGSQKVVPSPVVTQAGARVLPILPLYLQPAGGGGSGGLTAVMNPMPQVLLAPSLSVLPHRGVTNPSGGISGNMPGGARLLLPMSSNPQAATNQNTINLKISNGQIQTTDNPAGINVLKETRPMKTNPEFPPTSQPKETLSAEVSMSPIPFPAVTQSGGVLLTKQDRSPRVMSTYMPAMVTTSCGATVATTMTSTRPQPSTSPVVSPQHEVDKAAGERRRRLSHDLSRCLQEVVDAIFASEDEVPRPPLPSPPVSPSSPSPTLTTGTVTLTTTTTTTTSHTITSSMPAQVTKPTAIKEENGTEVKETIKVEVDALPKPEISATKCEAVGENKCSKVPSNTSDPNLEEFDPIKVLEWRDGIGTLPGSDLKFRLNEFGIMEMVDDDIPPVKFEGPTDSSQIKQETVIKSTAGAATHKKERNNEKRKNASGEETADGGEMKSVVVHPKGNHPKPASVSPTGSNLSVGDGRLPAGGDDIHCCEGCGCYGLASEFLSGRFCGKGCADQVAALALAACRVREARLRQKKRRQKRREILRAAAIAMGPSVSEANQSAGSNESGGEAPTPTTSTGPDGESTKQHSSLKQTPINSEDDNTSNDAPPSEHRSKGESGSSSNISSRVPWKVGKNGFSWTKYLDHCKAKAAPQYLFRDIYPCAKNSFKAGMKLEGIDPEHPSLFCVLTVAQVRGYRMRLHFDGYPEIHDFWTNADSPDLFPAGWCEKNGHRLQPPKGYIGGAAGPEGTEGPSFNWAAYLKQCRAQAAPRHLFAKKAYSICPTGFRTGMKLEAVDRKNQSLVCVATVADLLDSRILVHFDGWADVYDYWADPSSPYIHPVGWCKENGHPLTPPNGYVSSGPYSWESYLTETGAQAAPARAFKQRPPSGFRSGMRLEAVDPRVPSLVRVATVDEVRGHRLRLRFDGWSWNQDYGFWIDDDSPDIHPVGWCMQTGHPLEAPLTPEEAAVWPRNPDACPTPGCRGLGNSRGAPYTGHMSPSACPLTSKVLPPLPDRLDPSVLRIRHSGEEEEEGIVGEDVSRRRGAEDGEDGESDDDDEEDEEEEEEESKPPPPKMRRAESPPPNSDWDSRPKKGLAAGVPQNQSARGQPSGLPPPPPLRLGPAHLPGFGRGLGRGSTTPRAPQRQEAPGSTEVRDVRRDVHRSVFSPGYLPNPDRLTPLCWDRHSRLLHPFVNGEALPGREASRWTREEVVKFVENIPGCKERAKVFQEEQIDGEAFLLLNQNDIVTLLGFKLGPAIKVYNSIVLLRQRLTT